VQYRTPNGEAPWHLPLTHAAAHAAPPATTEPPARTTGSLSRWLWLAAAALSAACFVALAISPPALAQDRDAAPRQKTESPYFFVKSDNPWR